MRQRKIADSFLSYLRYDSQPFLGELHLEGRQIISSIHLVQFPEMVSPINILVVSDQFLERPPPYLLAPLVNFVQYLKVAVSDQTVLAELVQNGINNRHDTVAVLRDALLELDLDLNSAEHTARISLLRSSKALRASLLADSNSTIPSIAISLLLMCSFLWMGRHYWQRGSVHFSKSERGVLLTQNCMMGNLW